jgi:hypothetical protein
MNISFRNLLDQVTQIIPKGGSWITLQNIKLAFEILFFISWEFIKLGIFIIGLYYVMMLMPPIETIKSMIYN